jgi:hypothetical protein
MGLEPITQATNDTCPFTQQHTGSYCSCTAMRVNIRSGWSTGIIILRLSKLFINDQHWIICNTQYNE